MNDKTSHTLSPDHVQVILPPPVIFLGYLVSAVVLQWVVPLPTPWTLPLRILGGVLVMAGLVLCGSAFSEMMKAHTTPDPHQPSTALVTTGPYRFTRNPIYLGFLLIYLGFTSLAGTLWGLLLSPFLIGTITRWIIHAEEAYLGGKFKEEYQVYYSRVRQWI
jgi:protein-S-isoprenylcysteine O-methyltransferase Ste14